MGRKPNSQIDSLNFKAEQVKRFATNTLSKKFYINTVIEPEAARAIAVASILGDRGCDVWVNGRHENLRNLSLVISLQSQNNQEKS